MTPELLLKAIFQAAIDAALPSLCVPAHLPKRPKGRTVVIGAGKASGAMAKALEDPTPPAARPRDASSNWCGDCRPTISCSA